jgi:hypothetical protein
MMVESSTVAPEAEAAPGAPITSTLPETEMYAYLLVLNYYADHSKFQQVDPGDACTHTHTRISGGPACMRACMHATDRPPPCKQLPASPPA